MPKAKRPPPIPEVLPGGQAYWRDEPYTVDACPKCYGWGTVAFELASTKTKTKVWTNCPSCKARGRRKGAPPLSELEAA